MRKFCSQDYMMMQVATLIPLHRLIRIILLCTAGQKCFVVPLSYINDEIIRQLFNMSVEEFGVPSNGPTTLPCD
ncbi:unnamed protein product [Cuscuta campestris]|uniref:Uncharacterized protein n=1 Tax=Cuscuta campestris TaxID=132261 RepID=A0A484N138_9ASTE|nr:unnamed protein product [Cuscuta campestris]